MAPERTSPSSSQNTTCDSHRAEHVREATFPGHESQSRPQRSRASDARMDLIKSTTVGSAIMSANDTTTECYCCSLSDSMEKSLDSVHDEFATAQFLSNLAQKWAMHLFKKQTFDARSDANQNDDDIAFAQTIQDEIDHMGSLSEASKCPP